MTESWEHLGVRREEMPRSPLGEAELARRGLPLTLRRIDDESAVQQPLFDPALKHHRNAYRASDPDFADPAARARWSPARRTAMDLVLAAVADSGWREHLVLRGSVLLARWFGAAAREPADLDFVVVPERWRIEEERTAAMLDGIARAADRAASAARATTGSAPAPAEQPVIRFDAGDAVSEDIWTYDRVPGRRLVLPWTCDTTPGGVVQLDFVFNESLPVPPREVSFGGSRLLAATPALCLAWKLVWLVTDMHPQGKDLYDAVLLAEHRELDELDYGTLGAAFVAADPYYAANPLTLDMTSDMHPAWEWRHFAAEYPSLAGDPEALLARLRAALEPVFRTASATASTDARAMHRRWSAHWIGTCREVYAAGGLDALLGHLAERQTSTAVAAALVREFLGTSSCDPARAVSLVLAHPASSGAAQLVARRPEFRAELTEAVARMDIGA
ncbi:nucleotidyl transferase AbiEii/AbiGii toxin family protein [Streptomyces sp. HPF1205]|uniref:nucleotidyl transferase AbiEii/AbiGii toxin family protein n=1 Tax=Streptomyces sp. HPF1205 TaxID=2873262 RepID=UPI001CED5156|nr:nucleotidyl transferase AbiEii/AbiGii toxin family protein [Streptomyces sp. HPF1205]